MCAQICVVVYLCVRVVYTMCVSGSSLDELQQQQHMESGSSAHSPSPGNAAMPRAGGRTHRPGQVRKKKKSDKTNQVLLLISQLPAISQILPECILSLWLCPRRAVTDPHLDTPPLTRLHTAGGHSTDLHTSSKVKEPQPGK